METTSPNLAKIVNILNDGKLHDADFLAQKLTISRSAVLKNIKTLEEYGVEIQSVRGKGYLLKAPIVLLSRNKIKQQIKSEGDQKVDIEVLELIDSTNDYLKQYRSSEKVRVCLSECQSRGKGRLQRGWFSPFGKNIYLSCLYRFNKDISEVAGLSLVVGLAAFKTLTECGLKKQLFVKWPNDLVYDHKKIAGILIEINAETNGVCNAIIGIGINVNMKQNEKNPVSQPWTSISEVLEQQVDRNEISAKFINHLLKYLHKFETKGFVSFIKEWNQHASLVGNTVTLKMGHEKIQGKVLGINNQGHLLLKSSNGSVCAFSSGDVTILK